MTFSVLKSTSSNELQSTGKPSPTAASEESAGVEQSEGNIFSNLFSRFTGEDKVVATEAKDAQENQLKSADEAGDSQGFFSAMFTGSDGEEVAEVAEDGDMAIDAVTGKPLAASVVSDAETVKSQPLNSDVAVNAGDSVEAITAKTSETGSELLTRLNKSATLLTAPATDPRDNAQTDLKATPASEQITSIQGVNGAIGKHNQQAPVSLDELVNQQVAKTPEAEQASELAMAKTGNKTAENGNDLPLANTPFAGQVAGEISAKAASSNIKTVQGSDKVTVLNAIAEESSTETVADELAALVLTPIAMETSAKTVKDASSQVESAMAQSTDKSAQLVAGGYSFDGKGTNAKTNDSQVGFNAAASGAVDEQLSENITESTSLESEQTDFAQTLESVRRQEQPDQIQRQQARPQVLTEAEQQVLDKRVNINNASASSELNEKIALMAGKDIQTATIRLDPSEMGSMNIKLSLQNDQVNVIIQAQNHQSRDLLEQQLPRLREMLQQQGIALGDTQVQSDNSGQQQSAFQQDGQFNQSANSGQEQAGEKVSNNASNHAVDSQSEVPVNSEYWQDSAKGVDFYA